MVSRAYYKFVKYEDDDVRVNDQIEYVEHLDIPDSEKQERVQKLHDLKANSGIDWKTLFTLGNASDAPAVESDIFDQKVKVGALREDNLSTKKGSGSGSGGFESPNALLGEGPPISESTSLMNGAPKN